MSASFLFYDLETSGFNPSEQRIMQFAAQRTDLKLRPIGKAYNYLIKMTEDVVPDPEAVLVTGITPQQTIAEGLSEAEFLQVFHQEIATAGTIFTGYNSVRFDDEFMRYLHYRNYYDPYEWQYQEKRSRWDLLDVTRMMRALRPEGINWPLDQEGRPTNRLELLTAQNGIEHGSAHDALSDSRAVIALAKKIRELQPRLFEYLLKMRDKKQITNLMKSNEPFVYTSGKYPSEWEKTTVVGVVAEHPKRAAVLVFDLRYDPRDFSILAPKELANAWRRRHDEPGIHLPVKTLQFNRCPAVAPLSVLDAVSKQRLNIESEQIAKNFQQLKRVDLAPRILEAVKILDEEQQARYLERELSVDARMYENFFSNSDKRSMSKVRTAAAKELAKMQPQFKDQRLKDLLPLYKARNFATSLNDNERRQWNEYRAQHLLAGRRQSILANYFGRIESLQKTETNKNKQFLLEELMLYGESIIPRTEVAD